MNLSTKECHQNKCMIKFIKSRIRWGFESPSQGQELRDTQQVYCQKTKTKSAENEDDEFELLLRLQRQSKNFVKTLASLSKSYYGFLANDVQLLDVSWFYIPRSIFAKTGLLIPVIRTSNYKTERVNINLTNVLLPTKN